MFDQLNNFLGWRTTDGLKEDFILLKDGGPSFIEAPFLLHHFISFYLRSGHKVVLTSLEQTPPHYVVSGSKIGCNLEREISERNLEVVDLLGSSLNEYLSLNEDKSNSSSTLKDLYQKLQKMTWKVLIIDDVSLLLSLGHNENDVINFLHYLHVLSRKKGGCLITLLHHTVDYDLALYRKCERLASLTIEVQALGTGFSKDVHGNLCAVKRNVLNNASVQRKTSKQFKLTDRTLHIFAAGTSSAVL
uniref:elongator complex protein 6 n=1 Tax=Ciona intestinalis TaxID=7719 RepID=UPI00006A4FE8|nr:elongator complex protein 6 [Ciona intestinalis]|eukprot:XP_002120664.1 elongator complex protein 6 [Ciona intestinalis]